MFDHKIRPLIDPSLNKVGRFLANKGVNANALTLIGFVAGGCAVGMIVLQQYFLGTFFIIVNRICDGLDGAVARHTGLSDFGGFLDIVCDFIIYSGIVFAIGIAHPEHRQASLFLIFSFIGPITTFLSYAIIAAKHQQVTTKRGLKSFYYLGGICEGTETAAILILLCLLPNYASYLCYGYGALCWLTTIGRTYAAWRDFRPCDNL